MARRELTLVTVLVTSSISSCTSSGNAPESEAQQHSEAETSRSPEKSPNSAPPSPSKVDVVSGDASVALPRAPIKNLDELLTSLRKSGLGRAATVIDGRVKQDAPKYDLTEDEAKQVASYFLEDFQKMPRSRKLVDVLPRTTVELVRAVHERDVDQEEAEKIADYLLRVTRSMQFGNLGALDVSHSHVIGREWHQIDYSGEPMTWQRQKATWEPQGVLDFKRVEHIEAYFKIVSKMKFFKRVYRPAGRLPGSPVRP